LPPGAPRDLGPPPAARSAAARARADLNSESHEDAWDPCSKRGPDKSAPKQRARKRLASSQIIALDYNRPAIDEMSAKQNIAKIGTPDMTDKASEQLKASGWTVVEATGFISLVGPLWQRVVNGEHEYALVAQDKHHNRRGLVQGGLLMTFADRSCGMTARFVSGRPTLATVQMDTHFVDGAKIGEILVSRPRVIRSTRSLIFVTTEVSADHRCIAMANGVFKILKND
jgi:acyl-coenzyme A thioesterase PaaI-like protein